MTKHLWEVKHPYYMSEGNYYARDCHTEFKSWGEFLSEWGDADLDYNYVVRWDWREGSDWDLGEYNGDDYYRHARLLIQFVGQRKALLLSVEVHVCRADEAAIKEWLQPRFEYAMSMWEPFVRI
jgi:hypothetical protein